MGENSSDFKSSAFHQYYATLCMCLLCFAYGAGCGWTSAAVIQLSDDENIILDTGPIDINDIGWIASGIGIGGFIGNLFFGWLSEKIGRKNTLYSVVMPGVFSWLIICYAKTCFLIIVARCFLGLMGGGVYAVIPNYISEISDNKIRGKLGSFVVLACNIGIVYAYVCGGYFEFRTVAWLHIPPSIAFMILFARVADSPSYFIKRGFISKAENSVCYYKSIKGYEKGAKEYVDKALSKLHPHNDNDDSEEENSHNLSLSDFQSKAAKKAIIYGICLVALNQFCGCFAMITFTATIFQEAGSTLSTNASAIIVGVIQIFGSIFASILVERCGRKMMMSISALGTSMGLSILGFYAFMQHKGYDMENLKFIPLLTFSLIIFIANLGVLTLPFLILSEISHPKIRGFTSTLCMSFCWSFVFIAIKYLPILMEMIGMHGATFLFAFNSFLGGLFVLIFLPETKGKSFDEITKLLEGK